MNSRCVGYQRDPQRHRCFRIPQLHTCWLCSKVADFVPPPGRTAPGTIGLRTRDFTYDSLHSLFSPLSPLASYTFLPSDKWRTLFSDYSCSKLHVVCSFESMWVDYCQCYTLVVSQTPDDNSARVQRMLFAMSLFTPMAPRTQHHIKSKQVDLCLALSTPHRRMQILRPRSSLQLWWSKLKRNWRGYSSIRTNAFLVKVPRKDFGNLEYGYVVGNGHMTWRATVLPMHSHIPWLIHDTRSINVNVCVQV